MVNNGSIHYEHKEDGTMTQIGGCYAPVRNLDFPTRVAVSYMNEDLTVSHIACFLKSLKINNSTTVSKMYDDYFQVYVDNDGVGQWKICFKAVGVHLPTGYHFGISASTSDVTGKHYLCFKVRRQECLYT